MLRVDRHTLWVDKRVLRMDKRISRRVLRVDKRVLRVLRVIKWVLWVTRRALQVLRVTSRFSDYYPELMSSLMQEPKITVFFLKTTVRKFLFQLMIYSCNLVKAFTVKKGCFLGRTVKFHTGCVFMKNSNCCELEWSNLRRFQ